MEPVKMPGPPWNPDDDVPTFYAKMRRREEEQKIITHETAEIPEGQAAPQRSDFERRLKELERENERLNYLVKMRERAEEAYRERMNNRGFLRKAWEDWFEPLLFIYIFIGAAMLVGGWVESLASYGPGHFPSSTFGYAVETTWTINFIYWVVRFIAFCV